MEPLNNIENSSPEMRASFFQIMSSLESIQKDETNSHFKNNYASLKAVNREIRQVCRENGCVYRTLMDTQDGKINLLAALMTQEGETALISSIEIPFSGTPQHQGSAITYARRYLAVQAFNLDVDDDDGNAASSYEPMCTSAEIGELTSMAMGIGEEFYGKWSNLMLTSFGGNDSIIIPKKRFESQKKSLQKRLDALAAKANEDTGPAKVGKKKRSSRKVS